MGRTIPVVTCEMACGADSARLTAYRGMAGSHYHNGTVVFIWVDVSNHCEVYLFSWQG